MLALVDGDDAAPRRSNRMQRVVVPWSMAATSGSGMRPYSYHGIAPSSRDTERAASRT